MVLTFDVKGLRDSRKVNRSEVDLRVGNGARVAAMAVGTCELVLTSRLILLLLCTCWELCPRANPLLCML